MKAKVSKLLRGSRTVRVRLTVLYAGLFLACGTALLALTDLMMARLINGSTTIRMNEALNAASSGAVPRDPQFRPASNLQHLQYVTMQVLEQQATEDLHRLLAVSGIALAGMVLISAALGWLVAGRVLRPLREMTAATRRISADSLHERLAADGPADEMKDLADTIDGLLARLEAAFTAQRRFVANASHELRTPLAMLRTSVDVAMAKPDAPAAVAVLGGKLHEGLEQAERLLEGLLALARAQHGPGGDTELVPLAGVLSSEITARHRAAAAGSVRVDQAGPDAWVRGNRALLSRLAGNLIDNAIRYNVPGGWVRARTEAGPAVVRLIVENGGPVLEPDRVADLGQPFRRLADRTGSAAGTGLGLSIAAAISDAHGGTMRLHARPEGGLRVVIELPPAEPDSTPVSRHRGPTALALTGVGR